MIMGGHCKQVGTASLTGMMLDDSANSGNVDPLEWVQRQEVDELKVCMQQRRWLASNRTAFCKTAISGLKLCFQPSTAHSFTSTGSSSPASHAPESQFVPGYGPSSCMIAVFRLPTRRPRLLTMTMNSRWSLHESVPSMRSEGRVHKHMCALPYRWRWTLNMTPPRP